GRCGIVEVGAVGSPLLLAHVSSDLPSSLHAMRPAGSHGSPMRAIVSSQRGSPATTVQPVGPRHGRRISIGLPEWHCTSFLPSDEQTVSSLLHAAVVSPTGSSSGPALAAGEVTSRLLISAPSRTPRSAASSAARPSGATYVSAND